MPLDFDPLKSERNRELRGLPFEIMEGFVWSDAVYGVSEAQNNDTSTRFFAIGEIGGLIYVTIFNIAERGVRIVSLRRANRKERRTWLVSQTRS